MDLKKYIHERQALVEEALCSSIDDGAIPARLAEAMCYSLNAGGKRLRPVLVIAGAEAVGGAAGQVLPAAVALEMIHTFSLIHDDLPAMDDDDLRRGKPTNHKVFGDAMAILAGDGLLAEAFTVLSDRSRFPGASDSMIVDIMRDIAWATGPRGMTGGQVIDMESTGKAITEDELQELHDHKTGRLIAVSVAAGARLAGAYEEQVKALTAYGEAIGRAFQIADDILDIEGDQEEIGKDVGSDASQGKNTYPALIGMEGSRARAGALVDQAVAALAGFDEKANPLRAIARYVVERKK
jgi:geranylgeranyl diphosphate synthase type II